jgi:SNF2 family DNA or RNA helicase
VLDDDEEDGAARASGSGRAPNEAQEERPWFEGDLRGGTLVVCPTSVLHQWRWELREKVAASTGAGPIIILSSMPSFRRSWRRAGAAEETVSCLEKTLRA